MRFVVVLALTACGPAGSLILTPPPASTGTEQTGSLPSNVARSVLTTRGDAQRTGATTTETALTLATVGSTNFGKRYTVQVDGSVYTQPLVMVGLDPQDGRGPRDVVFVGTEHDSLYAFEAATGQLLWQVSLLGPDEVPVPSVDVGSSDISPEIGITGTPVIDPTTNTLYVDAKSRAPGPVYHHRLHALALETGAERTGSPVEIVAAVGGQASDAVDGVVAFNPLRQLQRPGLLLSNGVVWLAYGSHGDVDPYHGWLLGYDTASLTQRTAFNTTPDGSEGSIWQSGAGVAADPQGNLYVEVANGVYDADQGGRDYGSSVLKLSADGEVLDFFTPHDQDALSALDLDVGSAGPVVLPDQSGAFPHVLVAGSKGGMVYVLNRDSLGRFRRQDDGQILQAFPANPGQSGSAEYCLCSSPTSFDGRVFLAAGGGPIRSFTVAQGQLTPASATSEVQQAGSVTISANGTDEAIAWFIKGSPTNARQSAVLLAFDANDLTQQLYSSDTASDRDSPGLSVTFTAPTVVNGQVYVAGNGQLDVYGLLP